MGKLILKLRRVRVAVNDATHARWLHAVSGVLAF